MKPLHLYFDTYSGEIFDPKTLRPMGELCLTRGDAYWIRLQAVNSKTWELSSTNTAPTAVQFPLTSYGSNILFALKSAVTDTDVTLATSGFDTSDTGWHSLAGGRATHATAIPNTVTAGVYKGQLRLVDASDNYFSIGTYPLDVRVIGQVVEGDEASLPSGTGSGNWYTGSIVDSDSVAITVSGMTTGGKVIPVILGNSTDYSGLTAACTANTVTVTAIGGTGNYSVAVLVISL